MEWSRQGRRRGRMARRRSGAVPFCATAVVAVEGLGVAAAAAAPVPSGGAVAGGDGGGALLDSLATSAAALGKALFGDVAFLGVTSAWAWLLLPLGALLALEGLALWLTPRADGAKARPPGRQAANDAPPPSASGPRTLPAPVRHGEGRRGGGRRQRERRHRDRRQALLVSALVLGAVAALLFAALNVGAAIEPALKLRNVALWFLGTALGSGLALLLAWKAGRSRPVDLDLETPHA